MLPTLAARASFSPATVTSPAAVKKGDKEQRRAGKMTFGRRISADFSAEPSRAPRPARAGAPPVAPSSGAGASERTPLLSAPSTGAVAPSYAGAANGARDNDDACADEAVAARRASVASTKGRFHGLPGMNRPATVLNEFRVLVASSIPLSAGLMLENALNTINILVCGRLGAAELAVAGNSSLLVMVTGESSRLV
jgi:hypothetical protein